MFYSQVRDSPWHVGGCTNIVGQFLLGKKGQLARVRQKKKVKEQKTAHVLLRQVWLAAHWAKKLTKQQVTSTDVKEHVQAIITQEQAGETVPLALRLSGHLLVGVVRIFSRQVGYLYADASEAVSKIRKAFRAAGGAPADVDLPENQTLAKETAITLRAAHEDSEFSLHDVEVDFAELLDVEAVLGSQMQQNVAQARDITMRSSQGSEMVELGHSQPVGEDLPGVGGDWEIELGRAGELDVNEGPMMFDDGEVELGSGAFEPAPRQLSGAFEQDRDFFVDAAAGGLLDESMAAGNLSVILGDEDGDQRVEGGEQVLKKAKRTQRKKPSQPRKRKNAMTDEQTQLPNEEVMRRIQGGDQAIGDVFRQVELIDEEAEQQNFKQRRSDLAADLQELLLAPFEQLDEPESVEEFVHMPDSQPQQPAVEEDSRNVPLELGGDEEVDFGGSAPMNIDYADQGEAVIDNNSEERQRIAVDHNAVEEVVPVEVEECEGPLSSKRSRQFRVHLQKQREILGVETLSFDTMLHQKSRLAVAGSFYELLLFKTHNIVDLKQAASYSDIEITLVN